MKFPTVNLKRAILASLGLMVLAVASLAQNSTLVVVNGASFKPLFPLAPGSIASVFPVAANGFTGATQADAPGVPLPTTLGGAQVLVNDVAAPLFFASNGQINFQVPGLTPLQPTQATVRVLVNGTEVAAGKMSVFPASPGIFIADFDASDPRPGAILNQDNTLNTEANPAARDSVLQVFCNGLGPLESIVADGAANPDNPAVKTQELPEVWIGVYKATVEFSGGAPGFVALQQLNVKIPNQAALSGRQPIFIVANGLPSETASVWIAD